MGDEKNWFITYEGSGAGKVTTDERGHKHAK